METIGAFVVGVIIPVILAVFGRESVGKVLLGKQRREDTALSALISLAQESVAGWRESNTAVMQLTVGLDVYKMESDKVRNNIFDLLESQGDKLVRLDTRMESLIHILAEDGGK